MKKSLLALAVLGTLTSAVQAQTAVTVYGLLDAGLVNERGNAAGTVTKLSSGVQSGSRLGFRGTEDLGSGMSAKFVLETGIAIDTGGFNQSNTAFGRQAFVGLAGESWGSLNLGRQYTPFYTALLDVDPFKAGLAGNAQNLISGSTNIPGTTLAQPSTTRMNNAIKYSSPNWSGVSAEVAYGFGEVIGNSTANRTYGAAIGYANGPVLVKLAHHTIENPAGNDSDKNTMLLGTWDFGVATGSLAVNKTTGLAGVDSRDYLIGVSAPFGPTTLLASYIRKDDRTAGNNDANQWALGLTYALSKRTNFYTAYGRINNDNAAAYTVNTAIDTGTGDKAFNLGVRHTF